MESIFRSHQFGFGELLEHGWSIFRQGIKQFLVITLIAIIPSVAYLYWIGPALV